MRQATTTFAALASLVSSALASPGLIVAQHIVGNTENYSTASWAADIKLAGTPLVVGIDGFALQVGSQSFETKQVANAYDAAKASGTPFKLFLQLDMTSLPCRSTSDLTSVAQLVKQFASQPAQLSINNKTLVSTFDGSKCTFGQRTPLLGWQTFKKAAGDIHFVPGFFETPQSGFGGLISVMDGDFNYDGAFPTTLRAPPKSMQDVKNALNTDSAHIKAIGNNRTYMPTVANSFFSHQQGAQHHSRDFFRHQDSHSSSAPGSNILFSPDQFLYESRWEQLIAIRDTLPLVQILSWNDYDNSNYIGPTTGTVSAAAQSYAGKIDHSGWTFYTGVFIPAFKTGSFPTIRRDSTILWSRTHPANAVAKRDPLGRPQNAQTTADTVWLVNFAAQDSNVTVSTSDKTHVSYLAKAGISTFTAPIAAGGQINVTMTRGGKQIFSFSPANFTFDAHPETYNYNMFVAAN